MSATHQHGSITANRQGRATATVVEEQFLTEMRRRWRRVRGLVRRTVGYDHDALGLTANVDERQSLLSASERGPLANAEERAAFDFPTDGGVARAFIRWLRRALEDEVLEPATRREVREGKHWTAVYVRAAAGKGVDQSTGLLFQQGASVDNPETSEVLQRPIFARTLRDLFQRTYENLETVAEETAPQVRETLSRGLAEGWNPKKMARKLTDELREIQRARAETLARTETMHAHSEATLRNYERAGVDTVSHGEWQATRDTRTCPFCRRLSGAELTIEEMSNGAVEWRGQVYRLQPPSHPNGRCVILPSVGGTPPTSPLTERVPGTVITGA